MRESTCCFTGHRKIPPTERDKIVARLEETIIQLYQRGITNFIAGGALGFDTMAAEAVLRLRESLPEIKLILALPCENQGRRWSAYSTQRYEEIKQMANEVIYVSHNYTHDCMYKRNRYMVDNSSVCVSYQTKDTGGTAYTVGYAEEQRMEVIRLSGPEFEMIA